MGKQVPPQVAHIKVGAVASDTAPGRYHYVVFEGEKIAQTSEETFLSEDAAKRAGEPAATKLRSNRFVSK